MVRILKIVNTKNIYIKIFENYFYPISKRSPGSPEYDDL
jgi:hypothetical protein